MQPLHTSDQLLSYAHELLKEAEGIKSSHDIVDTIEIAEVRVGQFEDFYKEHGHSTALDYFNHAKKFEEIRSTCLKAEKALGKKLKTPNAAYYLAVGKFNVGACAEKSMLCFLKATQKKIFCCKIIFVNPYTRIVNHTFLIFPLNKRFELPNYENIDNLFKKLNQNIIVDPLLKIAFKARNFITEGAPLRKYLAFRQITRAVDLKKNLDPANTGFLPLESLIEESNLIFELAQTFLKKPCLNLVIEEISKFVQAKEKKQNCQDAVVEMERIFPDTKWKSAIKNGEKVFVEGSKACIEKIKNYLKKHQIDIFTSQIKNSENYCAVLNDPKIASLKAIPMDLESCIQSFINDSHGLFL